MWGRFPTCHIFLFMAGWKPAPQQHSMASARINDRAAIGCAKIERGRHLIGIDRRQPFATATLSPYCRPMIELPKSAAIASRQPPMPVPHRPLPPARSGMTFFGTSGTGFALAIAAGIAIFAALACPAFDVDFAEGAVGCATDSAGFTLADSAVVGSDPPAETLGGVEPTICQTTGYRQVFQPIETAASINPNNVTAGFGISFPFSPNQHLAALKPIHQLSSVARENARKRCRFRRRKERQNDWVKSEGMGTSGERLETSDLEVTSGVARCSSICNLRFPPPYPPSVFPQIRSPYSENSLFLYLQTYSNNRIQ